MGIGHNPRMDALERLRDLCLAQPRTIEKLSHGQPCWFIEKGRQFAAFVGQLHGDTRTTFWLAAPPGAQEALIQSDPDLYFRPPYVGGAGWIGVNADAGPDWEEIRDLVEEAWQVAARGSKQTSKRVNE